MEGAVLHRVGILRLFLSFTGSGYQTLSGTPIPKHGPSAPTFPTPRHTRNPNAMQTNRFSHFLYTRMLQINPPLEAAYKITKHMHLPLFSLTYIATELFQLTFNLVLGRPLCARWGI